MINKIASLAKIENILAKMSSIRFNAILPVNIDVKEKIDPTRYLLQIGKREISTKSLIDLEVGSKYWGVLKEDMRTNSINLSNLLKKPKLLNLKNQINLPHFSKEAFLALISKENPKSELKALMLQSLANANSKSDFVILSNMLLALNENVFSFVLKEDNKNALFQLRKRKKPIKSATKEDIELEFYAAFEHLGPVEGVVESISKEIKLTLNLYYENSAIFLQRELKNLGMIAKININKDITPLFESNESLLDLKG